MYGIVPTIVPACCEPERGDGVREADEVGVNRPRQPEVQDLYVAIVGHHHVRGFQIAMDDVFPVRRRKRVGQRNRDVEEPRQREPAVRNPLVERAPLDELHRHERNIILFLDGEDGDDMWVVERGDGLGFPSESRQTVGVQREGIGKNLQRNSRFSFVSRAR